MGQRRAAYAGRPRKQDKVCSPLQQGMGPACQQRAQKVGGAKGVNDMQMI